MRHCSRGTPTCCSGPGWTAGRRTSTCWSCTTAGTTPPGPLRPSCYLIDLDPTTAAAAAEFLPRFRYLLDDLTKVDIPTLRARPMPPVALLMLALLKIAAGHPHVDNDLQPLLNVLDAIMRGPHGWEEMVTIVTYIQIVSETPDEDLHQFFAQLGPHAEEAYVTTADMLQAKGRAQGRAEGRAETLLQQLTIKFGPQIDATVARVHNATPEQLETWTARILTADTLDDVLG